MAIGVSVLTVITQDGNVFGADVEGQDLRPVFQFSGAKIGFNPQDRFMVATSASPPPPPTRNRLVVITQPGGDVFGADVVGRDIGPVFQFSGAKMARQKKSWVESGSGSLPSE
jgi:hypothetical protein